jgi:hypothetical protein
MTETPNELTPNVEEKVVTEKYNNTIFKSAYWYGKKPCHMFVNYNVGGHQSFSFILKTGPISLIHNLKKDDKLSFVRNVLAQLSKDELELVLKQ